ncbi:telomere repeat-binding factor 1-like isoform X2 [Solanum stenotomum]|nr:telomere repeat-binding factor 1-like isoform X2 [Solanum stenotomum]
MSVMTNGCGSREKARLALKRMNQARKQDKRSLSISTKAKSDEEMAEARLATTSSDSPQIRGSKRSIIRLENLIMEAISNLKVPGGSNKTTIATYIEFSREAEADAEAAMKALQGEAPQRWSRTRVYCLKGNYPNRRTTNACLLYILKA